MATVKYEITIVDTSIKIDGLIVSEKTINRNQMNWDSSTNKLTGSVNINLNTSPFSDVLVIIVGKGPFNKINMKAGEINLSHNGSKLFQKNKTFRVRRNSKILFVYPTKNY